jgi:hemoglobin-like flavoprotein
MLHAVTGVFWLTFLRGTGILWAAFRFPFSMARWASAMTISESLRRILSREDIVADLFYEIFLDRHPVIRSFFIGVDMKVQALVLTMALVLLEQHSKNEYPTTHKYLMELGRKHKLLGVEPHHYAQFQDCLLEMLGQFHGRDWDEECHGEWKQAIELASSAMLQAYA